MNPQFTLFCCLWNKQANYRPSGYYLYLLLLLFFFSSQLPLPSLGQKKTTTSEVEPIFECVKYVGQGKYEATFGYRNNSKNDITVSESGSFLTSQTVKPVGKPVTTFRPGRQEAAFKAEFDGNKLTWTIKLPNGNLVTVETNANAFPCSGGGNNIVPYYTPPSNGKNGTKIGAELSYLFQNGGTTSDQIFQISLVGTVNYVFIEAVAHDGQGASLLTALKNLGFKDERVNPFNPLMWAGNLPIPQLDNLNNISSLKFARPVYTPLTNAGLITTQGDAAQRSGLARTGFKLQGQGVKVGVLSNSFDTQNGAGRDLDNLDLPGPGNPVNPNPVEVVKEFTSGRQSDEGRAMLQLVHDVAPKAQLAFRTAFYGAIDFADGILELMAKGCQVITDDVTYITEPFFQDGQVARAVEAVTANGVAYFTAAGNYGSKSYQATFSAQTAPAGVNGYAHKFGGTDVLQRIALTPGTYTVALQWDDEFSTLGQGGADTDLDIYLADDAGRILYGFNRNNLGSDPIEILPFSVIGEGAVTNLMVINATNNQPVTFKYIIFRGDMAITEYSSNTASTIVGQANAAGAITVGAVLYKNTPAFGVNPPTIASFSSVGGTPILRSTSNTAVNQIRNKPDIAAPNGGNTSVVWEPESQNIDDDLFSNFFGTSAAAPHAAGVAALLLEGRAKFYSQTATPAQIKGYLQTTTLDMATAGFDFQTGYGFIQADAALASFAKPAAVLSRLVVPDGVTPGPAPVEVIVEGEFLNNTSEVYFNRERLPTVQFINANKLKVTVPAFTDNPPLQVYNAPITPSGLDGGYSNPVYFFPDPVITVKADDKIKSYGDKLPDLTATISGLPLGVTEAELGLTEFQFNTQATELSDVGLYAIQVSKPGWVNPAGYEFVFQPGALKIEKTSLVIKANDLHLTYGDNLQGFTYTYNFTINNTNAVKQTILGQVQQTHAASLANATALANNSAIVDATALANHSFLVSATALANATPLANGTTLVTVNAMPLANGTPLVNATPLANGTALVDATALANGTATLANGTPLANATPLANGTPLVNSNSFGEGNNQNTVLIFAGESSITNVFGINLVTGITAGTHLIAPASLIVAHNFNVTYQLGQLFINKKPLTVTADDKTIELGDPLPVFTSKVQGLTYTETLADLGGTLTYTVPVIESAGTYPITPAGLTSLNYAISFVDGILYVNPTGNKVRAVKPILNCVEDLAATNPAVAAATRYRAWFGYDNPNAEIISIPVDESGNNKFSPGTPDRGQVTVFRPGVYARQFYVDFDGSSTFWSLTSKNGTRKTSIASEASSTSARCHTTTSTTSLATKDPTASENLLALKQAEQNTSLAAYPNPVTDQLIVNLKDYPGASVSVLDVLGRICVPAFKAQNSHPEINMAPFKAGVYVLRVQTGNHYQQIRFLKK